MLLLYQRNKAATHCVCFYVFVAFFFVFILAIHILTLGVFLHAKFSRAEACDESAKVITLKEVGNNGRLGVG